MENIFFIKKVIKSCKNKEQLDTCVEWICRVYNTYKLPNIFYSDIKGQDIILTIRSN